MIISFDRRRHCSSERLNNLSSTTQLESNRARILTVSVCKGHASPHCTYSLLVCLVQNSLRVLHGDIHRVFLFCGSLSVDSSTLSGHCAQGVAPLSPGSWLESEHSKLCVSLPSPLSCFCTPFTVPHFPLISLCLSSQTCPRPAGFPWASVRHLLVKKMELWISQRPRGKKPD